MTESKIKKSVAFGDWRGVNWGYVVPSDGFLKITAQPSGSTPGYVIVKANGTNRTIVVASSGYDTDGLVPVHKGEAITQGDTVALRNVILNFIPI